MKDKFFFIEYLFVYYEYINYIKQNKTMETIIRIIKEAILNNEKEYKGITLPTRQTSGSDRQIITYAEIQARNFYTQNIK